MDISSHGGRGVLRNHSFILTFLGFIMSTSNNVDPYIYNKGVITDSVENLLIYGVFDLKGKKKKLLRKKSKLKILIFRSIHIVLSSVSFLQISPPPVNNSWSDPPPPPMTNKVKICLLPLSFLKCTFYSNFVCQSIDPKCNVKKRYCIKFY